MVSCLQIAWSVMRSNLDTWGPLPIVLFNLIVVNLGGVWNQSTNTAVIKVPGLYYLHVQMSTCFNAGAKFEVNINGKVDFTVEFLMVCTIGGTGRYQAVIRKLAEGDTIMISMLTSNTCVYGNTISCTAFYGFFLGPQ